MKNKTCGECCFFESKEFICCHSGDEVAAHFIACYNFEPMAKPKPTNGDKIRQMTNSQLSKFLARISNCSVCFPGNPKGDRKWWYDWTFAPAESEVKNE